MTKISMVNTSETEITKHFKVHKNKQTTPLMSNVSELTNL